MVFTRGIDLKSTRSTSAKSATTTKDESIAADRADLPRSERPDGIDPIVHSERVALPYTSSRPAPDGELPTIDQPTLRRAGDSHRRTYGVEDHHGAPISTIELRTTARPMVHTQVQPLVDAIAEFVDERLARSLADAIRQGILPR